MDYLDIALLFIVLSLSGIFYWMNHRLNYWEKQNAPYDPEGFSSLGKHGHFALFLNEVYKKAKAAKQPFMGTTVDGKPIAVPADLNLIKSVLIGDFQSFPDRAMYHNLKDDPLSSNIFRLEGEVWKRLRVKLTPAFTSGKMKMMFPKVVEVGENFIQLVNDLAVVDNCIEARDLCARFTTDVISSVAFGIDCDSLGNPDTPFREKGDKVFSSFRPQIEKFGLKYPRLFQMLGLTPFPRDIIDFYSKIVTETVEYREKNQVRRNDYIDLLIDLKNKKTENGEPFLTMKEIIGQSFVFFIAGFETSSTTMSFCLYELSRNPDIQEKARKSVMEALAKHDNQLTYESIKDMNYLEKVMCETLRKHPVGPFLKRVTRIPYRVPNTSATFDAGIELFIPVYAIHHDEEYYPDPWKFNPENFSAEALKSRDPLTFMPFGGGPRVCIGERFGRMQTKIGLAMLLKNLKFSPNANTPEKLDYDVNNFRVLSVKEGIPLNVESIK